jgi:hypothetical protein
MIIASQVEQMRLRLVDASKRIVAAHEKALDAERKATESKMQVRRSAAPPQAAMRGSAVAAQIPSSAAAAGGRWRCAVHGLHVCGVRCAPVAAGGRSAPSGSSVCGSRTSGGGGG